MSDLIEEMLKKAFESDEKRRVFLQILRLTTELLEEVDPDGKTPLSLLMVPPAKPEPDEDEDGEDDKKQDEPSEDAEKTA